MHRLLLTAFPDRGDGGPGRLLYRLESSRGEARVLAQSEKAPDWTALNAPIERIRGPREARLLRPDGSPAFREGQVLRFRLRANPTFKRENKRRAWVKREDQSRWLARKGERHGFDLIPLPEGESWFDPFEEESECRMDLRIVQRNYLMGWKPLSEKESQRIEHFAVDFDGALRVTHPARFVEAIRGGIGPAKGFGFGLLSVPLP
jgi:CRISPR system Cascade subunit CasE